MSQPKYYRIHQTLPKPWYKRHFLSVFQLFACLVMVTGIGTFSAIHMLDNGIGSGAKARTSSQEKKVARVQAISEPTQDNIIDVQSVLDAWSKEQAGQKWGVVVQSLDGPSFEARINQDIPFEVSSLYPLYMTLPLYDSMPSQQQSNVQLTVNGTQRSVEACTALMIRLNDMSCASAITEKIGLSSANKRLKTQGLKHTSFNERLGVKTTAGDTAQFLVQLRADLLKTEDKNIVLRLLKEHTGKGGIALGCPGCSVSNKTQSQEAIAQDSAIVQYKRGSYVISVFGGTSEYSKIAELSSRVQQKIVEATSN